MAATTSRWQSTNRASTNRTGYVIKTAKIGHGAANTMSATKTRGGHVMEDRILRISEVCALTGLSRTTIWRRTNDGSFPPPIRLGPEGTRAKGWRLSDIQAWIDDLPIAA